MIVICDLILKSYVILLKKLQTVGDRRQFVSIAKNVDFFFFFSLLHSGSPVSLVFIELTEQSGVSV